MKAEELMKNNLIEFNGYVEKVASFDDSSITSFRDGEGRTYSYISAEPIPLTKEWLLRLGLSNINGISFLLGCYELVYSKGFDHWNVILKHGIVAKLKYVHQLQNFYFILSGIELKE